MTTGFEITTSFQSDNQSAGQSLCYMVCLLVNYEISEFCCAVHNVFPLIRWSAVVVVCYQHFRTMSVPSLPLRMVLTCCHKISVTNYQVMLQTIPDRGRMVSYLPPKLIVLPCCLFSFASSKAGVKFTPAFEDGTDRVFRNIGIYKSDAGESPKRKQTTW